MFAHYIVVNGNIVVGSSVEFDEIEWPRIIFKDGSLCNLNSRRVIRCDEQTRIVFLNPEDEGYINPAALSTEPPAGSRVTIIKRIGGVTVVGSPGDARLQVTTRTCDVIMDGASGVQIGNGNTQILRF